MKIRTDFVTNSSSSSFIIAKHENFDINFLEALISTQIDEFTQFYIDEIIEEGYHDEELFKNCKTEKQKKKKIKELLLNKFNNLDSDMKIDNWSISLYEGNSESDDLLSLFLYNNFTNINEDTIKISEGNN